MKALCLEHDISVSTYDIDFAGHVSNIVYLRWLEDMRLKMFDTYCPLKIFMDQGLTPILVSTEIHYRRPINLFDRPQGKMWLSDLGLSKLSIEAEIYLDAALTTRARHVGVFVNMKTMKPTRVPQLFHDTVARYLSTNSADQGSN